MRSEFFRQDDVVRHQSAVMNQCIRCHDGKIRRVINIGMHNDRWNIALRCEDGYIHLLTAFGKLEVLYDTKPDPHSEICIFYGRAADETVLRRTQQKFPGVRLIKIHDRRFPAKLIIIGTEEDEKHPLSLCS